MESTHVTIVHQNTRTCHMTDYTQLYDFLKYNQKEVDDLRAERLAKTHDPLALMANSNNPFNYPVFHQDSNAHHQNLLNLGDEYGVKTDSMRMVGANGGNQFRQYAGQNVGYQNEYNAVQNVGNQVVQDAVQNQGVQNIGNQNGQIGVQNIGNGNVVQTGLRGNAPGIMQANRTSAYFRLHKCIRSMIRRDQLEVHNYDNCYDNEKFILFTQREQYIEILEPIPEPHQVQQNDNVISDISGVEQEGGTVDQHTATVLDGKHVSQAVKFVRDFKSLAKEADESLAKHKTLELEIERLLRAVVSQDIMSIVQNPSVVDSSNLQTELDRTKERLENVDNNALRPASANSLGALKDDRVPSAFLMSLLITR
ncbi:hypothetical protein Tco_0233536 [Tanacetum coccineum]